MARAKLTVNEISIKVEKGLKSKTIPTKSDQVILQLIQSKSIDKFTEVDLKKLKNKYNNIIKKERLENRLEYICSIKKEDRSSIENDIVEYSGYENPFFQNEEKMKISLKMLINYIRKIPDEIKLLAHNEIKNSINNTYKQKDQKVKRKKKENHEKFFLGGVLLSFLKTHNPESNYLDITLAMIKLHLTKNYFDKENLLDSEINEFNFSENGIKFNEKKNVILSDPKNPFSKSSKN